MVGAVVVASALIFGAVAGGVIVHRLDVTPSASSEQEHGAAADKADKGKENGEQKGEKGKGHRQEIKKKHAANGQQDSTKQGNSEDK